uniref:Uncharacterized protein n=1 Tax=Tanacetum cinerariifolium TaxID=118510 RepID=A0A699L287_TANCI|nr:hypothetical protein [Tanacetum cinerariifolium]
MEFQSQEDIFTKDEKIIEDQTERLDLEHKILWVQLVGKSAIISLEFFEASIAPHLMVGTSQIIVTLTSGYGII